jgi:hypothetical protein
MQSFESFGFAIELFVLIFSFFCWLSYTPASFAAAAEHEISRVEEAQKREEKELEDIEYVDVSATNALHNTLLDVTDCVEFIEKLNLENSRKLASLLMEENLLPADIKLKGKGITKDWIQKKIKNLLPTYLQSVEAALEKVLHKELT